MNIPGHRTRPVNYYCIPCDKLVGSSVIFSFSFPLSPCLSFFFLINYIFLTLSISLSFFYCIHCDKLVTLYVIFVLSSVLMSLCPSLSVYISPFVSRCLYLSFCLSLSLCLSFCLSLSFCLLLSIFLLLFLFVYIFPFSV